MIAAAPTETSSLADLPARRVAQGPHRWEIARESLCTSPLLPGADSGPLADLTGEGDANILAQQATQLDRAGNRRIPARERGQLTTFLSAHGILPGAYVLREIPLPKTTHFGDSFGHTLHCLVLHPAFGAVILETTGGYVRYDATARQWETQTPKTGERQTIKNPIRSVMAHGHLFRDLVPSLLGVDRYQFPKERVHAVAVFPDTPGAELHISPAQHHRIACREDVADLWGWLLARVPVADISCDIVHDIAHACAPQAAAQAPAEIQRGAGAMTPAPLRNDVVTKIVDAAGRKAPIRVGGQAIAPDLAARPDVLAPVVALEATARWRQMTGTDLGIGLAITRRTRPGAAVPAAPDSVLGVMNVLHAAPASIMSLMTDRVLEDLRVDTEAGPTINVDPLLQRWAPALMARITPAASGNLRQAPEMPALHEAQTSPEPSAKEAKEAPAPRGHPGDEPNDMTDMTPSPRAMTLDALLVNEDERDTP